jgi:hypothetical protein
MAKKVLTDLDNSGRTITTGTITATVAGNLTNPLLTRIDSASEGGQINFARSTDGVQYWYIDTYGSTSTPDLRVIENSTERFRFGTGGVIYVNGSTGTSGQVLTSGGPSAAASWTTVSGGGGSSTLSTNAQTGTTYTLVLSDGGKIVEMNNASANTLTIPLNSSVAVPIGTEIIVIQTGAGQTSIAVASGVTLNCTPQTATNAAKLRAQWSSVSLIKRATDTWIAIGDLTI